MNVVSSRPYFHSVLENPVDIRFIDSDTGKSMDYIADVREIWARHGDSFADSRITYRSTDGEVLRVSGNCEMHVYRGADEIPTDDPDFKVLLSAMNFFHSGLVDNPAVANALDEIQAMLEPMGW